MKNVFITNLKDILYGIFFLESHRPIRGEKLKIYTPPCPRGKEVKDKIRKNIHRVENRITGRQVQGTELNLVVEGLSESQSPLRSSTEFWLFENALNSLLTASQDIFLAGEGVEDENNTLHLSATKTVTAHEQKLDIEPAASLLGLFDVLFWAEIK